MDEKISTGLSLHREELRQAGPAEVSDQDRFTDLLLRWPVGVTQNDLAFITAKAQDRDSDRAIRYECYGLLGGYYKEVGDFKRADYYYRCAAAQAQSHSEKAELAWHQLELQTAQHNDVLDSEGIACYDRFAVEAMNGILNGEKVCILLAINVEDVYADFGLAAGAYLAWSRHPENDDPFKQEEAEAAYYRCRDKFQAQISSGCTASVLSKRPEEGGGLPTRRARLRMDFLSGKPTVFIAPPQPASTAQAVRTPVQDPAPQSGQAEADQLMASIEGFARKYPGKAGILMSAKAATINEYILLSEDITRALERENTALMRAIIASPEVFEDMQDYILLSAAATLWLIHPDNTDGREKIAVQKNSILWNETSLALAEAGNGKSPIQQRLEELNDDHQVSTYVDRRHDLLRYTQEKVKNYQK